MSETIIPAVAEIVTFRLTPGTSAEAFVEAAAQVEPLLAESGAVLGRTLSQDEDGLWTDHILWTSMAAAKSTAAAVLSDPRAAPMMTMVNPEGVSMRHAVIHHIQR